MLLLQLVELLDHIVVLSHHVTLLYSEGTFHVFKDAEDDVAGFGYGNRFHIAQLYAERLSDRLDLLQEFLTLIGHQVQVADTALDAISALGN